MSYPMPLISEGKPSYTNDDYFSGFPAVWANDATYATGHCWRCFTSPVGNANDGPLTQTVWWVVDLSSVPAEQRQQVLFCWQNDNVTGAYASDLINTAPNNLLKDYTVKVNTAAGGGSPPVSGWTTVGTVTGNILHSKQTLVNMNGANWIGVYITAVHGSLLNNNAQGKFAVHDARLGALDSWIAFGDSITVRGFMHDEGNGFGQIMPKQIHGLFPGFYPYWEAAGIGGWTAQDIQSYYAGWIAAFPGKYVAINFGTNDANLGGFYVSNYQSNMQNIITAALNAGKTVVIPTIPWLNTTSQAQANVITLNGIIASLIASNPGCIAGPDLYGYFSTHQSDISNDGLHPTDPSQGNGNGYVNYKTQWVNWASTNIYRTVLGASAQSKFKTRMVLADQARSAFKIRTKMAAVAQSRFTIKLINTGPKPYQVSQVASRIAPVRPYSTINSQATVIDQNGATQSNMNVTVTVTFPDNSTATPVIYSLGSGVYSTSYQTKGVGTLKELWIFTDGSGGQVEYENDVACSY
jgi:lysophospholipase L1-like esterase